MRVLVKFIGLDIYISYQQNLVVPQIFARELNDLFQYSKHTEREKKMGPLALEQFLDSIKLLSKCIKPSQLFPLN